MEGELSRRTFLVSTIGTSPVLQADGKQSTNIVLDLPATVSGNEVTIAGRLQETDQNTGLGDKRVVLYDEDANTFADDLNFAPNQLAQTTTDAQGRFSLQWQATTTFDDTRDLETYVEFPGTERYESSRAPETYHYPVQVQPSVVPYDFTTTFVMSNDVILKGDTVTSYVLVSTPPDFRAAPPISVPQIALAVSGIPDSAYSLEPTVDKPLTAYELNLFRSSVGAYYATFDLDSSQLATGMHEITTAASSIGITKGWSGNERYQLQVVPRTEFGFRRHGYSAYARLLSAGWWESSAAVKYLDAGTTDLTKQIADRIVDVVAELGRTNPSVIALKQLADAFVPMMGDLLESAVKVTVAGNLASLHDSAGIDSGQILENFNTEIPTQLREEPSQAASTIQNTLTQVRTLQEELDTTDVPNNTAGNITKAVVNNAVAFLEAEAQQLEETSENTTERAKIEFIDCTTVRITGEFESVVVSWSEYDTDIVTHRDTVDSITGSTTITISDVAPADFQNNERAVIDRVDAHKSPSSEEPELQKENPDSESCHEHAQGAKDDDQRGVDIQHSDTGRARASIDSRHHASFIKVDARSVQLGGEDSHTLQITDDRGNTVTLTPTREDKLVVTESMTLGIYDGTGSIRGDPKIDAQDSGEIPVEVTGDTSMFEPDPVFSQYTVAVLNGTETVASTNTRIYGIGYTGTLSQKGTSGEIEVSFPLIDEVKQSWTVLFSIVNYASDGSADRQVQKEFVRESGKLVTTFDTSTLDPVPEDGFRDFNVEFYADSDPSFGNPNLWAGGYINIDKNSGT